MRNMLWSCVGVLGALAAPAAIASPNEGSARSLVEAFEAHVAQRARASARALLSKDARAQAWDATRAVKIDATFRSRAEGLTITVERRPGVRGDLVVPLLPGVVGLPQRSSGAPYDDPCPQDLLLLRAPVIHLTSGAKRARVQVPVACASFRRQGPQPGHRYTLTRAKVGSVLDALAQTLCAAPTLPSTPELALAIWIGHEGLTADRLGRSGFRTFPTPRERVLPSHGAGAERLLKASGLDTSDLPFFRQPAAPAKEQRDPTPNAKPAPRAGGLS